MNRLAASVVGGSLLVTALASQVVALPSVSQASAADQAADSAARIAVGLTGLLSIDYVAPAERRMLAQQPQQCVSITGALPSAGEC